MARIHIKNLSPEEIDELLPPGLILLGYRGSIAHDMYHKPNNPDSIDDRDVMGVSIAPIENYFGLSKFEQRERMVKDVDSVVYELRKFVSLLMKCNPNVLSLLWLEPRHYIYRDAWGWKLINNRDLFVSRKIYHSFTGYAYGQLKRMQHANFEGYMAQRRKALVQKYGYDCKNASHCIRLLRTGIEFLREGELHVHREDATDHW